DARMFSSEAKQKANNIIREIHDEFKQDLVIETFPTPPGGEEKAKQLKAMSKDKEALRKFFAEWEHQRARDERIGGVHVLICQRPGAVEVGTGPNTEAKIFAAENRDK